jgi:AbiV family abortive infection protein
MARLNQFRGFLTTEKIVAGINAAIENSARLAQDAELLLNAGRVPTACSLALLSLEESGKVTILRQMATATKQSEVLDLWKRYRRHLDKHSLTLMPDRIARGARRLQDFKECVTDESLDERMTYDNLKQLGFYTDCLGTAHWSIPTDVIDERIARMLVAMATTLTSKKQRVTTREIELWTMHTQSGLNRKNLMSWAKAVEAEGLQPAGYAEGIAQFTLGAS